MKTNILVALLVITVIAQDKIEQ